MGPAFATGTEQVELNGAFSDYGPVLSADGLNIYFNSDRPGGSGNLDVWFATRASLGAAFQPPVNAATLNSQINTSYSDRVGCISPDGCRLYLVNSRPGVGASDIYIAERSL
jgi:Tol biopolymer transport system component